MDAKPPDDNRDAGDPCRGRLDGWKAIATYLGTSSRTAHRYEADRGLPIHRLRRADGTKSEKVFAYKKELDNWRHAQSLPPPVASASGDALPVGPAPDDQSPALRVSGRPVHWPWIAAAILVILATAWIRVTLVPADAPTRATAARWLSFAGTRSGDRHQRRPASTVASTVARPALSTSSCFHGAA